jgi:hypothetical protein
MTLNPMKDRMLPMLGVLCVLLVLAAIVADYVTTRERTSEEQSPPAASGKWERV